MMKNPNFVQNGFFIMIWFVLLIALIVAFVARIVACIRKSKQSGEEWNFKDKYAANEFGE